jgi:arsenite methyltransferase
MSQPGKDIWCEWLLRRRFGGDPAEMKAALDFLYPIRDKVLENARLAENEVLLDVGCGDGLIAFGALEKVKTSRCIFSDISQDLLDHVGTLAREMGVLDRCRFVRASADDLSALEAASVDVVTTRSVLIYVAAKQQAFDEFYRVLKPQGRLSIFEPINRFYWPEPPHFFWGYDVGPVQHLAQKISALYHSIQPPDSDPMLDFDERDLIRFAEQAGFHEIHLELQVTIKPGEEKAGWDTFIRRVGNPKIPSLEEAMGQTLTEAEARTFTAHLRPLVESNAGVGRGAVSYLWAVK